MSVIFGQIIDSELYRNLGISMACVFATTLILLADIIGSVQVSILYIFFFVADGGADKLEPSQPSLMFAGRAKSMPKRGGCSHVCSDIIIKQQTKLERLT